MGAPPIPVADSADPVPTPPEGSVQVVSSEILRFVQDGLIRSGW